MADTHSVPERMRLSEPTTKNWMKIDPYYQQQKWRPLSLVSGDIKFVWIFAGILWKGGVKREWGNWGNQKRRFSWLLDAKFRHLKKWGNIIIQYYLVPCHLSSDPKIYGWSISHCVDQFRHAVAATDWTSFLCEEGILFQCSYSLFQQMLAVGHLWIFQYS